MRHPRLVLTRLRGLNLSALQVAQLCLQTFNRNYSRRQASCFSFEGILWRRRQVLQIRQFHVVGDLPKPQSLNQWPNETSFLHVDARAS
jgi:hypothetical protein